MSKILKVDEDKLLKLFTEWHVDEETDTVEAMDYANRLLARIKDECSADMVVKEPDGLHAKRRVAADRAFENFDFEVNVEAFNGWEISAGGCLWTRAVFLENDVVGEPSLKETFVVIFEPNNDVIEDTRSE